MTLCLRCKCEPGIRRPILQRNRARRCTPGVAIRSTLLALVSPGSPGWSPKARQCINNVALIYRHAGISFGHELAVKSVFKHSDWRMDLIEFREVGFTS